MKVLMENGPAIVRFEELANGSMFSIGYGMDSIYIKVPAYEDGTNAIMIEKGKAALCEVGKAYRFTPVEQLFPVSSITVKF